MTEASSQRIPKWASFRADEPPWGQVHLQVKRKYLLKGPWGYFLRHCYANPKEWFRSHPLLLMHTAQQAVYDIEKWPAYRWRSALAFDEHEQPVVVGPEGAGIFEARWGHDTDDNGLEQWYVWARWVPNRKPKREPRSASNTTRSSPKRKKAK